MARRDLCRLRAGQLPLVPQPPTRTGSFDSGSRTDTWCPMRGSPGRARSPAGRAPCAASPAPRRSPGGARCAPAQIDRPTGRGPSLEAAPEDPSENGAWVHRIGPKLQDRLGTSHGRGCPVGWSNLRYLRLPYIGFDDVERTGGLVSSKPATPGTSSASSPGSTTRAGRSDRWRPVSDFDGDDDRSMAADTLGVQLPPRRREQPVVGTCLRAAIEINPVENPYLLDDDPVHPPSGRPFAQLDRTAGAPVPAGTHRSG